ncbi:MAG: response regulator transcription factor [Eubacteriales bacterium]|jgi:two-component system KDP operon response regulator KdpE|nr:response regulator transcription factor [Eubacteriales bacterium]MDD3572254.1 response regulator transcription factor [Eubacteriales bacterium]MDD4135359.1 response regulator transcription factor [Eubacteriales bacterium]NLO14284.1 response regulator transcription factor [Clostridiales bacterium]
MRGDNPRILVIEDDRYIADFIALSLRQQNYSCQTAASAAEGLFLFQSNRPDIVLLDLGLPDRDGLEVIRELRGIRETPVLIVSARGQEKEKIDALDAGADDYITKPFHMGELMARIRVAQRKLNRETYTEGEIFSMDDLKVDPLKRQVLVGQEEVHLTPLEYRLLLIMIRNRGKVLTHNHIAREVWGYGESESTQTIRVVTANLRRKIERDSAKPRYILTEIGVGYRFADE